MRRVVLSLAAASMVLGVAACGGADVTILTQLAGTTTQAAVVAEQAEGGQPEAQEQPGTDMVALGTLPVRLLPYDRDALFDSLSQAYPEPEPQVPDSIRDLQDRVLEAQRDWQQAENRWGLVRDSLQRLAQRMQGLSQSSGEYFALFQDFTKLEGEVGALERRSRERFQEFTRLQNTLNQQSREIALARHAWEDEAFAPVDSIIRNRLELMKREELVDTTTAQGVARFRGVKSGQWWVHARYERAYDELYWNVPIEVARGEELTVRLTEENAEVRGKL